MEKKEHFLPDECRSRRISYYNQSNVNAWLLKRAALKSLSLLAVNTYSLALQSSFLPNLQVGFITDHGFLSINWRDLVLIKQEPQVLYKKRLDWNIQCSVLLYLSIKCVLPVVPHYPAILCSSFVRRLLWIPLSASEVILHPLLVAAYSNTIIITWILHFFIIK